MAHLGLHGQNRATYILGYRVKVWGFSIWGCYGCEYGVRQRYHLGLGMFVKRIQCSRVRSKQHLNSLARITGP